VGDTTLGVKINGELRPLRTALANGDVVEVIRGPKPVVPVDWRSLTVTGRARSAIRRHIRLTEKDEFLRIGRASIDQTFERAGRARADVTLREALDRFTMATPDDLFEAVGRGRITASQVLDAVFPGLKDVEREAATARSPIESGKGARLYVRGGGVHAGTELTFASCCSPVPGDRIVGIVEDKEDLWRDLQWTPEAERNTISHARLRATIKNAPGVLGKACTIIGEAGGNIMNLRMHHRQSGYFDVDFDLDVRDARHLTHVAAGLRACPEVDVVDRAQD
jgi:GTP pyrophosphokinase/guanosine-3',5'-bis(diphosphate) 3'-pyrophosphohydrolase